MASFFVNFLGALIFLFIFWKKIKEDHASEVIFSAGTFVILGIILGYFVSARFFKEWFFWLEFLGGSLGLGFSIIRFKIRPYEAIDAFVISLVPWLALTFVKDSIVNSSLISFIAFLACLAAIFVYFFLEGRYKSFFWYRSGKVGFSGLSTLGLFFLTRSTIAIFFHNVLSFSGKSEIYISAIAAFISFLLVFNLSRQ